jgi:hypothetical protein
VAAAIALAGAPASLRAQQPAYQGIPAGFDFPAAEAHLLRLRDQENVTGMRVHAWNVFAGMTQPAAGGEAIWETWYPSTTTMRTGAQPQALVGGRAPRVFTSPRQFQRPGEPAPQAAGASLLSFVMFNKEAHEFIRGRNLHRRATLTAINDAFPPDTPPEQRKIPDFPREAMSLKLVWQVVKGAGLTAIPVWDAAPTRPDAQGNPEEAWARVVLVDTTRADVPAQEVRDAFWRGRAFPGSRVVPLSRFYSFRIGQAEVAAIRRVDPTAQVGDHAVLLAMHYTTKEIPDWVWATFWWHDRPDAGPFAMDRPTGVAGVWRNYLMDAAYSMDTPHEYEGTPNSVFNPYLEARFQNGMSSNCMTCHQIALVDSRGEPPDFLPVTRGPRPAADPLFAGRTKLDFLWSLAFESN